jgi:hypothetical protein
MSLTQINHWTEYASAGIDLVLLLRVLGLRLQRAYVFLTLAAVLTVFFDGVQLWLPHESSEFARANSYSQIIFAVVFPLAAWDAFEEIATPIAALRRLAILRTLTSLVMITFFALLIALVTGLTDDPNGDNFLAILSLILWTGSATASLAFLWTMHRAIRAQKLETPNNTFVWMIFFELLLAGAVVGCFISLVEVALRQPASGPVVQVTDFVLNLYGIGVTIWCIIKLRALPKDLPSPSLHENS